MLQTKCSWNYLFYINVSRLKNTLKKKKKKTLVALLQKYIFFAHIELMGILE